MPFVPNIFSPATTIESAKVNENFATLDDLLPKAGGTMTGDLNSKNIDPETTNSWRLGSITKYFTQVAALAFKLVDTNASHLLSIVLGSNITANRLLTLITGDSDRTLTFTADASIGGATSGTNTGDKLAVKVVTTDSGSATADAQEDTLHIVKGNDGVAISATAKTVTVKGRKFQARVDVSDSGFGLTIPATLVNSNSDVYTVPSDGFIIFACVEFQEAGTLDVKIDGSNPPTTVMHSKNFNGVDDLEDTDIVIPVAAGEFVQVTATGTVYITRPIYFLPLTTA